MKVLLATFLLIFSSQAVDFEKDIKPIFDDRCAKCHGEEKQKSDLRLDLRSSILKGGDLGEPGAVPGHPEKSTIYKLISLDEDHDDIMPPKGDPLTKKEIDLIGQWIKEGAKMPEKEVKTEQLWSYKAVSKQTVPDKTGNPVDSFLSEKLKEKNLSFNPQADPTTLLRRLQVTLTGFLPSHEEAAKFLADWSKNEDLAYSKKVEELLASKHYGERWAQHWLDSIRWAETSGSESNLYRKFAWKYRDYVINSFNKDKPYSNFIIDQIAGDQTGFPRATGFLVSGPHVPPATVGQEPSAVLQARYDRLDQVMQTIGASMMGQTLSCARCHSHKFDPIKINDYYSILANFQGMEFGIRVPELGDHNPSVQNGKKIMSAIKELRKKQNHNIWLESWRDHSEVHFDDMKTKGIRLTFTNKKVFIDEMEIFDNDGNNIIKNAKLISNLEGGRAQIEKLRDGEIGNFYAIRGTAPAKAKGQITILLNELSPVSHFTLSNDRKRLKNTDYEIHYNNKGVKLPTQKIEVLRENGKWDVLENNSNRLKTNPQIQKLISRYLEEGPQYEFIGRFIQPVKSHVLKRGGPSSPGAEVNPGAIATITSSLNMTNDTPEKERRLNFAKWLASKDNPLTARVMVNRLWHHTFGTGIVSTLSDFGNAGATPSHPELLDYLAAEFMDNNWSVKHMLRLYVKSKAFKQSSKPVESALKVDADSRLLWRYPPRRAEAEVLRDSVLKLSASLNTSLGGISYRIHNTKKRYALWQVVDNHSQTTWRRMIYQERMRGVDDQMFTAFDFPDCGQVLSKRPSSTTPLQALNLMNSKFIDTQCEILANKFHSSNKADSVKKLFSALYNRNPNTDELEKCLQVLETESLKILCRAMINSNEFVFIQ